MYGKDGLAKTQPQKNGFSIGLLHLQLNPLSFCVSLDVWWSRHIDLSSWEPAAWHGCSEVTSWSFLALQRLPVFQSRGPASTLRVGSCPARANYCWVLAGNGADGKLRLGVQEGAQVGEEPWNSAAVSLNTYSCRMRGTAPTNHSKTTGQSSNSSWPVCNFLFLHWILKDERECPFFHLAKAFILRRQGQTVLREGNWGLRAWLRASTVPSFCQPWDSIQQSSVDSIVNSCNPRHPMGMGLLCQLVHGNNQSLKKYNWLSTNPALEVLWKHHVKHNCLPVYWWGLACPSIHVWHLSLPPYFLLLYLSNIRAAITELPNLMHTWKKRRNN